MNGPVYSHKLPAFLIIGAQKAGTTSLHQWLVNQPAVCLPAIKETHFFSADANFSRGVSWYLDQFPGCFPDCLVGEVASDYLFIGEAATRIRALLPDCRLIAIFREPLARAFSHYLMSVRKGHETLPFQEALLQEEKRTGSSDGRRYFSYLSRGLYVEQIRHYLELFPRENILFVKFDDLIDSGARGRETKRRIAGFIGLKSLVDEPGTLEKANPASRPRFRFVRDILYGASGLKRFLRILIPSRDLRALIAHRVDLLNLKPEPKPEMGPVPSVMAQKVAEDVARLQELTGLDLRDWMQVIAGYEKS